MNATPLKTPEQIIAEFACRGQSIRSWSLANDLNPAIVWGLLHRRYTGRIGQSHKAAVKLGLKHGEITGV